MQVMKKHLYSAFQKKVLADVMNNRPLVKCDLVSGQVLTPSLLLMGLIHKAHTLGRIACMLGYAFGRVEFTNLPSFTNSQ